MLYAPVAEHLKLPHERVPQGGDNVTLAKWPAWSAGAAIPPPMDESGPFGWRPALRVKAVRRRAAPETNLPRAI